MHECIAICYAVMAFVAMNNGNNLPAGTQGLTLKFSDEKFLIRRLYIQLATH